jgi:hypothetical protein
MNRIVLFAVALSIFTGCASSTVIRSSPSGAKVLDRYGQVVGKTPYVYEDAAIVNNTEWFTLEMAGYEEADVAIRRNRANAGRIVGFGLGGIFAFPVWAGLLWSSDYAPEYHVELEALEDYEAPAPVVIEPPKTRRKLQKKAQARR